MTYAEAAQKLENVLKCAKAGKSKSCRVEEEALILAIWALTAIAAFEKEMDNAILYGVEKEGDHDIQA